MFSSEGEKVQLSETISTSAARGAVEKWLLQVQDVMAVSLRDVIEQARDVSGWCVRICSRPSQGWIDLYCKTYIGASYSVLYMYLIMYNESLWDGIVLLRCPHTTGLD